MKVTLEMLERMPSGAHACHDARAWFSNEFPDGADWTVAWAACPFDEWRIWFACHALPARSRSALVWKFAGQAFRFAARRFPKLRSLSDNVSRDNYREAYNAANDAYNDAVTTYDAYCASATYSAAADAASATGVATRSTSYANAAAATRAAAAYADAADAARAYAAARQEQVAWCEEALRAAFEE